MVTLKFERNDGKTFEVDNALYKVNSLEGFDYPSIDYSTQSFAEKSGIVFQKYRTNSKDRTMVFTLMEKQYALVERLRLQKFFNPRYEFKVFVTYGNTQRWFKGKIIGFKCPNDNVHQTIQATVTILSENPYMHSVDEFGNDIASKQGRVAFPYISILNKGFVTGVFEFEKEVELVNNGDEPTYFKIDIYAKGEVVNPKIIKDGKFIRILDTLLEDDEVTIDLTSRVPKVTKNGKNIIGKCDKQSTFIDIYLDLGSNKVSYDADNGSNNMSVYVYYNEQYLGI